MSLNIDIKALKAETIKYKILNSKIIKRKFTLHKSTSNIRIELNK